MSESKPPGIVASKDFGDFKKQKETIVARTTHAGQSKRARIIELIASTEEQLQTSNSIIQNAVTLGESFKVTKQIVNTLLAPAKELADILGSLSEIHPAIGVVATVFKAVVRLETDRQENDRQIAVLYDSMAHMLIVLVYMEDIFERKDGIQHMLTQKLDDIANLIKEFGNFCDVYYKSRSIDSDEPRARSCRVIATKGGIEAVLKMRLLRQWEIKSLLRAIKPSTRLAQQLVDNRLFFDVKMEGVKEQISEKIERSTNSILLKMEDGPHELVHDPDIKKIWKEFRIEFHRSNGVTVSKAGTLFQPCITTLSKHSFVTIVFDRLYYKIRSHAGTQLTDYVVYPAIGDAIDEDNSGYVSLHELNHFFSSKPHGWSVPQWLAYWAAGWYKDNLRYRDKIMSRLKLLEDSLQFLRPENEATLRSLIDNIKPQIRRIVLSLYDDVLDYFQGESEESTRLDNLRNQFTAITTKEVEEQLAKSKFELDDKRTLKLVLGRSRFESRLFCVMHRLLKRHHKFFDLAKDNVLQEGVAISMANSWDVIFDAFVQRMRELSESWRQQRMDVNSKLSGIRTGMTCSLLIWIRLVLTYARLFEDWYTHNKALPEAEDDYGDAWAEEDYDAGTEVDESELVEYATRPSTSTGHYDDVPSILHSPDIEASPIGDMDFRTISSFSGQNLRPGEGYHKRSSSRATNESDRTSTAVTELEDRMKKLEGKVDNLTDLMTQILQQLKGK
ncbi:hypothetical protein RHS01_10914 [Rhizoctonia solani]|uniref:EF-hand domain-containing protein n=1 Tax=Rhizoctonia solani TaxID=456999 RepID=A0A8H7I2I5_9AGAM|nr:hypothetical protein RHS01_10914 [Rhizoctonia solani]